MDTRSIVKLSEAIELHSLDCKSQRFTSRTIATYRERLTTFLRFAGDIPLAKVTPVVIKSYLVNLIEKESGAQTQKGLLSALRAFFNYCVRDELIESSPMKSIKMPRVPSKVLPAVSDKDFDKAIKSCDNPRDKALLLFLATSGVRAAEAVALNVEDVDIKTGIVSVKIGKMQKGRTVYIDPTACKALRIYLGKRKNLKPTSPLFASNARQNSRLRPQSITQIMIDIKNRTKISYLTAHGLRRRFATKAMRAGMNIHVTARIMGHASIDMLKLYLDIQEEDAQDAYFRIFG